MGYGSSGSPVGPFSEAVVSVLRGDAALAELVGGSDQVATKIVTALRARERTAPPYITVGRSDLTAGAVAMQKEGGQAGVYIEVWSATTGPAEAQAMQSRIRALFARDRALTVPGYAVWPGSLEFVEEMVMPDFDPDMPERSLYRGLQRLVADLEDAA